MRLSCTTFVVLFSILASLLSTSHAYLSREERQHRHPEIFQFPYVGRGDPDHTFRHPYEPSPGGDPVNGWFQLGTTVITRGKSGRDIVRLTSASQANQGIFYNAIRTETPNFNGYFDIEIGTVRESHEAADGLGFFFTQDHPEPGSAMGISHKFKGLGIIIDTFSNSRSRHVPYIYAYVSDGVKPWNPNTDGADTELTRGCQLELDTQVRVYVQFIDGDLHVGVAMNPRSPHRWHTCFKASNVRLPFNEGGYLVFAGETGHFFAQHEVHDAVFIDESPHSGEGHRSDYGAQSYGHEQAHTWEEAPRKPAEEGHHTAPLSSDPSSRVHKGDSPESSLSGSLDLQVYDVFNAMTGELAKLGDHLADDTRMRLDGVKDVTAHLVKEMERQKNDMGDLISVLKHLKQTAGDLTYSSDRFMAQVLGLHKSLKTLREKTEEVSESHDDMHADILEHHSNTSDPSTGGGAGMLVMFLVIQLLLGCAFYFVNRMSAASRKIGRMV